MTQEENVVELNDIQLEKQEKEEIKVINGTIENQSNKNENTPTESNSEQTISESTNTSNFKQDSNENSIQSQEYKSETAHETKQNTNGNSIENRLNVDYTIKIESVKSYTIDLKREFITTSDGIKLTSYQSKIRFLKQCIQEEVKSIGAHLSVSNPDALAIPNKNENLESLILKDCLPSFPVLMKIYWRNQHWAEALQLSNSLREIYPSVSLRYFSLTHAIMSYQLYPDSKTAEQSSEIFTARKESLQIALKYYHNAIENEYGIQFPKSQLSDSITNISISPNWTIDEKIESIFCLLQDQRFNEIRILVKDIIEHWTKSSELITNLTSENQNRYYKQRLIWLLLVLLLTTTHLTSFIEQEKVIEVKNILNFLRKIDESDVLFQLLVLKLSETALSKRYLTSNLMNIVLEKGNEILNDISIGDLFIIDWEFLKRNSEVAHSATNHIEFNSRAYKPIIDFNRKCSENLLKNLEKNKNEYEQRDWRWCIHEIFNNYLRFNYFDHATTFLENISEYASTTDVLYFKGRLELFKNQLEGARQLFEQCLFLQSNHVESNLEIAQIYYDSKEYLIAKYFLQQVFQYSKGHNYRAHKLMAHILKALEQLEDSAFHFALCVEHEQTTPIVDFDEFLMDSFVENFLSFN